MSTLKPFFLLQQRLKQFSYKNFFSISLVTHENTFIIVENSQFWTFIPVSLASGHIFEKVWFPTFSLIIIIILISIWVTLSDVIFLAVRKCPRMTTKGLWSLVKWGVLPSNLHFPLFLRCQSTTRGKSFIIIYFKFDTHENEVITCKYSQTKGIKYIICFSKFLLQLTNIM